MARPRLFVTRKLPDAVEARLRRDYDVLLNEADVAYDTDDLARLAQDADGVQQRVEIIKSLSRDAKVLVFDEPTAVLTPQETDELMVIMRQLKESGTSIVFITHKLREVREVPDPFEGSPTSIG